jgi:cysteinyl-tRNA synthetase
MGFDGRTIRYWLLATHYRTVLRYSRRELERAAHSVARLNEFVARLRNFQPGRHSPDLEQSLYEARTGCQDAMDNDLNVPQAIGKLFAFLRHTNRLMAAGELDADQVQHVLDFMHLVNRMLDVIDFEDQPEDPQVRQLIDERNAARHARNFEQADALRQQLQAMGVQLIDSPSGTRWKKSNRTPEVQSS